VRYEIMKIVLVLFLVGFVLFCGWLVAESGLFCNTGGCEQSPCILLQQATTNTSGTANRPVQQSPQLQPGDLPEFGATGGLETRVTLGSTDPKSGFKLELELSSKGAAIEKATFSEFDDRDPDDPQPLVILSPAGGTLPMANKGFVFVQQQLLLRLNDLHWKSGGVERGYDGSQTARFEALIKNKNTGEEIVKLTKTYRIVPGSYLLGCEITIENLSADEHEVRFNLAGPIGIAREAIRADMRKVVGGFRASDESIISTRKVILTSFFGKFKDELGLKDASREYQQARSSQLREGAQKHLRISHQRGEARFLWAATTNKYFAAILRPVPDDAKDSCDWVKDKTGWFYNPDGDERGDTGDETVGVNFEIKPITLAPVDQYSSSKKYSFQLYLGPKDKWLFDKNQLYRELGFVQTIDFLTCCCPASIISPLAFGILTLMKWMYGFIYNYGVVIIILVFLMRLCLHPITKKSQVSMNKMTKLAPKAEQIKKKYAGSKAEMNKQLMALYKEQGASPIMGFLPMMVQMPIWLALWSAINTSIDLRGAPFLPFWITDLSAPDALIRFSTVTVPLLGWKIEALNLLPILMGVAFYLQQKLMPKQASAAASPQLAQQQKMMMIMMPLLFPLMLYKLASGVNLYIMTSTFAGVIEQCVIKKHIREKEEAESKGLVAATSKTGGKVKKKKPKPFYKM